MKNLIFLLFFVLAAVGVACQDQSTPTKTHKYREIAMSDLYARHQENFYRRALVVATRAYDRKAVDSLFRKYPEKLEMADFDKALFENIRGGLNYYDIEVESYNLNNMLDKEFHFDQYSHEEMMKIDAIFDEMHHGRHMELLQEKVAEYFKNKNKE